MRPTCLAARVALPLALALIPAALAAQNATIAAPGMVAGALAEQPQRGAVQMGQLIQAEIRPGWTTPAGTRIAALHLRLAPGWKTYWRVPGEAGIAPRFDWSASQNLGGLHIHWPRPEVFDQGGFRSIGYHDELVLPLEITPARPGRPIVLDGQIALGVCDDICVPVDLHVTAALRGEGARDPLIAGALATVARPAREGGLRGALRCSAEPAGRGLAVTLRATLPPQGAAEHMVMELPGARAWVGETRTWREGADLMARAQVRAPRGEPLSLDRSQVLVTVLGGARALEHAGCTAD